jgi:hypothetical protein
MVSIREFANQVGLGNPPISVRALVEKFGTKSLREAIFGTDVRRCGVPDPSSGGILPAAFGSPGGRWSRGSLTYNVNASGCLGLTPNEVNTGMASAFQQWQAVAPFFSFSQVSGNADIQIQFGGTNLNLDFGQPGGVSGSATYPESGRLSFDSSEIWTSNFFLRIALHEIGHVLGLAHSTSRSSVMYPYATMSVIDTETKRSIEGLYGWQPQIPLGDRGSVEGPSLAVVGGPAVSLRPYMAWRGVSGDDGIYWSSFDGNGWSPQKPIQGTGSSHGPILAVGFTRNRADGVPVTGLFMAWDGVSGDDAIYFAENLDPTFFDWTAQQPIDGVGTSERPALALFNGRIYMAWKGVSGDSAIYWSSFDGNGWSPQQQIPGRGTSHGPSLAVLNDRLYMFWKGIEDDSNVFSAWIDDQPNAIWQAQRVVAYTEAKAKGNVEIRIGTSSRPAACVRNNAIVLAWKGVSNDTGLYFAYLQNDEWSGQINVAGVGSSSGPGIATLNGRLYMAWKGIPDDTGLYYSWLG